MRRPTVKQLLEVRGVVGNGWGDGDYVSWMDRKERERITRSLQAFEDWLEHIGNFKFDCPLVAAPKK